MTFYPKGTIVQIIVDMRFVNIPTLNAVAVVVGEGPEDYIVKLLEQVGGHDKFISVRARDLVSLGECIDQWVGINPNAHTYLQARDTCIHRPTKAKVIITSKDEELGFFNCTSLDTSLIGAYRAINLIPIFRPLNNAKQYRKNNTCDSLMQEIWGGE